MKVRWTVVLIAITFALPSSLWAQTNHPKQSNSSVVEAVGCVDRKHGRFELTNAWWFVAYYLEGKTAELRNHIGDEVTLRGIELPSPVTSGKDHSPKTLQVTNVDIMVHKNPVGVRPILGSPDTWINYENPRYGLRLRYPATFGDSGSQYATVESNFAGERVSIPIANAVVNVSIPKEVFPDSNYVAGGLTVFVDPEIRSAGTCQSFHSFWPEHTASTTIGGISYFRTLNVGVGGGTARATYYFHTFQNGLCYEFAFDFAEGNGGGMDVPCSIQWVSEKNNFELMRSVFSTVSFAEPQSKPPTSEVRNSTPASVISFEHGPVVEEPAGRTALNTVDISWKANADYVQIRYPCTRFLFASTIRRTDYVLGICGEKTDRTLPANGSMSLLLSNFNSAPVDLVLTIVPFRGGMGNPKESKTISVLAPVHPHGEELRDK